MYKNNNYVSFELAAMREVTTINSIIQISLESLVLYILSSTYFILSYR